MCSLKNMVEANWTSFPDFPPGDCSCCYRAWFIGANSKSEQNKIPRFISAATLWLLARCRNAATKLKTYFGPDSKICQTQLLGCFFFFFFLTNKHFEAMDLHLFFWLVLVRDNSNFSCNSIKWLRWIRVIIFHRPFESTKQIRFYGELSLYPYASDFQSHN